MIFNTPNLSLPLLASGQAQKHITHNEALVRLDRLCALSVISRKMQAPPDEADEGTAYLISAKQASNWGMDANSLAFRHEGHWVAEMPKVGQHVWVGDENKALVWNGVDWHVIARADEMQRLNEITVDNDQVFSLALPTESRDKGMLMLGCDDIGASALLVYDLSSNPDLIILNQADTEKLGVEISTLTGFSGPQGRVSLSPQAGAIQIENRLGATYAFRTMFWA